MDHMRISGIEPSSVILSQRKKLKKLKNNVQKVPKEAKAKRDGEINLKIKISINFNSANWDTLKTLQINRSRP